MPIASASRWRWQSPSLAETFDVEALSQAWSHVLASDLEDGQLSPSMKRFDENAESRIEELHSALAQRAYVPKPLTAVVIPKANGGSRDLQIPSATDRVVERALAVAIGPCLDSHFAPTCFAYRSGMSVLDAVRKIVELRGYGYRWVVRADVRDCFPTVNRSRLWRMITTLGIDPDVLEVIHGLIERPVRVDGLVVKRRRGLPQGGSISPMLSNLYLTEVDVAMWARGFPLIRYSDDMVLLAPTLAAANEGLRMLERAVAKGDQRLGAEKTQVVSFEEGFAFLGEEFNLRYPAQNDHAHRAEPPRRTLHVGFQGCNVFMKKGRIIVAKDDAEMLSVPSNQVGRFVLAGSIGLSAGVRSWALQNGVSVLLLSRRGNILGAMSPASPAEAALRRRQYSIGADDQWALEVAKAIVFAKLSNQRALLMDFISDRDHKVVAEAAQEIAMYRHTLVKAETRAELLGVEGIAARSYWKAYMALLPEGVGFQGRARRPPPDVVNATLGYAYAVLLGEAITAIAIAGLDPSCGLLHVDDFKRPSLALDLMEEVRPVIVDRVVLELFRNGRLTVESGREDPDRSGGVLLNENGRRVLLAAIEDRLLTVFRYVPSNYRVSYRRALQLQAVSLAGSFRAGESQFAGLHRS